MGKPRILVVEDRGVTAQHLAMSLRQLGYDPCGIASSGVEAVDLAKSLTPDLVLMDIMLTDGMDGIEAAGVIRSTIRVPVVFLSAYSDEEVVNRAKAMEPFGYLLKPFRPEELRTTIEVVLCKHRVQREAQERLEQTVSKRTAELLAANERLKGEMLVREQTEKNLRRTNRALRALSGCNKAVTHANTESDLLTEVCRIVVEEGEYPFVWVGLAEQDEGKTVRPVSQWGYENGYLQTVNISWSDSISGRGPTGTAIRTGKPCYARRILTDPDYEPWREEATKRRYASSVALPLMKPDDSVLGALNVYAFAPDAFDEDETHLLQEIADSLAHGIITFRAKEDLQRSEQERRKSDQRYREIFETSRDGLYVTTRDGEIQEANRSFRKMFDLGLGPIRGMNVMGLYEDPNDRNRFQRQIEEKGSLRDFEVALKSKDGRRLECLITSSVCKNQEGTIVGYAGSIRDVTDRKALEQQLFHAHKMEAIGTLAGGIAHDFNNILNVMIGFSQLADDELPENSPIKSYLFEVVEAGRRGADLVRQILTFSRQTNQQKRPTLLAPLVKEVTKFLKASLPTTISIRHEIKENLKPVLGDPTQIHQVLMNLCANAGQAMQEKGGDLALVLQEVKLDASDLSGQPHALAGWYQKLTVKDTGPGIDRNILGKVFDPYFTTKDKGKGTGLGLSVVDGIVKAHRGVLEVETKKGKGSAFHVYVPVSQVEIPQSIQVDKYSLAGSETILVVDDEETLVEMFRSMLERLGYKVVTRTSSVEALKLFGAKPMDFDIVVTDMTMPNMTGKELTHRIREIRPDIPIVLCTGFSELINEEQAKAMGIQAFVMKPVLKAEIAKTVRDVLDSTER